MWTINLLPLLSFLGTLALFVMLVVLGLLSKRLGGVTRTAPYYIGFFIAAGLVGISAVLQILDMGAHIQIASALEREIFRLVIYSGLPALAFTIGVIVAWRYWSWLLAERN